MTNQIWLIGSGPMAVEYAKILKEINVKFIVIGRGIESAKNFQSLLGVDVFTGGVDKYILENNVVAKCAIVTTGVESLYKVADKLISCGVSEILVEKPGGVNVREVDLLSDAAKKNNAKVFVGYNRRFYSSVIECIARAEIEGGIKSINFEFTEWSHEIENLKKLESIKKSWLFNNSTHVIDLVFYMTGGTPRALSCYSKGGLNWHNSGSIYAGSGVAANGALFSYQANWESAGRWGIEVCTNESRMILRPLEKLQVMKRGEVSIAEVSIRDDIDRQYKPGLYHQLKSFLGNKKGLCTIDEQSLMSRTYYKIANYDI